MDTMVTNFTSKMFTMVSSWVMVKVVTKLDVKVTFMRTTVTMVTKVTTVIMVTFLFEFDIKIRKRFLEDNLYRLLSKLIDASHFVE